MNQYIKLSNQLELTRPRDKVLYAMIAAYLAIPNFHATHGGFKKFLMQHTASGIDSFTNAWNELRRLGYIKMKRIPTGHMKFEYVYELRSTPDLITPSMETLTAPQGRQYFSKNQKPYQEPTKDYMTINREVLLSPQLNFHAKWLWAIIRQELDWFARPENSTDFMRKEHLQVASKLGNYAFNTAWNQLKAAGYLRLSRFFDRKYGTTRYQYDLSDIAQEPVPTQKLAATVHIAGDKKILSDRPAELPQINRDYKAIEMVIKENINYDGLLQFARQPQADGFSYSKGQLDRVVSCMISNICSGYPTLRVNGAEIAIDAVRERLLSLDCDHIQSVLRSLWKAEAEASIQNPRAYLLTVLFNALDSV